MTEYRTIIFISGKYLQKKKKKIVYQKIKKF